MYLDLLSIYLIDAGVTIEYNNKIVNYGDVLSIDNIGESYSKTLVCKTTKRPCCFKEPNRHGEWHYPSEEVVPARGMNHTFYRSRNDEGEVLLKQRIDIAISRMPGLYCCVIPDSDDNCGITQRFCINLGKLVYYYTN